MRSFAFVLIFISAPLITFGKSPRAAGVELSVTTGKAPLTVTINGPAVLLQKAKACERIWGGVGYSVDWGDGSRVAGGAESTDCVKQLTHTYSVPGKFSVHVAVFHPGPTDAPIYDFQGDASVEVTGSGTPAASRVKLLLSKDEPGDVFYGTGLPALRFLAETGVPIEVKAELVKNDSTVLYSEEKSVSFTGNDSIRWGKYGNGPAAGEYKNGKLRARYRVIAFDKSGKQLSKDESPLFTIHANATFRDFELAPLKGKAPLEVEASSSFFHAECASYIVEWGDGSADEQGGTFSGKKTCPLQQYKPTLKHTYRKRGAYTVRWHDNNGDPFKAAAKGPGYMEKQVKVD